MKDINNINLVGRLTRDAELKQTQNGFFISEISLAVNSTKKQGNEYEDYASFFDVKLIGKIAESLNPFLKKAQQIVVSGRLNQDRWVSQDGQNRSKINIIANDIQLVGSKKESNDTNMSNQNNTTSKPANFEDDIPF